MQDSNQQQQQAMQMRGFLLKRNREYRKSNLLVRCIATAAAGLTTDMLRP